MGERRKGAFKESGFGSVGRGGGYGRKIGGSRRRRRGKEEEDRGIKIAKRPIGEPLKLVRPLAFGPFALKRLTNGVSELTRPKIRLAKIFYVAGKSKKTYSDVVPECAPVINLCLGNRTMDLAETHLPPSSSLLASLPRNGENMPEEEEEAGKER